MTSAEWKPGTQSYREWINLFDLEVNQLTEHQASTWVFPDTGYLILSCLEFPVQTGLKEKKKSTTSLEFTLHKKHTQMHVAMPEK